MKCVHHWLSIHLIIVMMSMYSMWKKVVNNWGWLICYKDNTCPSSQGHQPDRQAPPPRTCTVSNCYEGMQHTPHHWGGMQYAPWKTSNIFKMNLWYYSVLHTICWQYCTCEYLLRFSIKGIVSRDWEQIQWIPSDWSEECRVAGAYFSPVLKPFLCFNLKNACFGGFSFDSYSANDK
jgi:hypothetical protein